MHIIAYDNAITFTTETTTYAQFRAHIFFFVNGNDNKLFSWKSNKLIFLWSHQQQQPIHFTSLHTMDGIEFEIHDTVRALCSVSDGSEKVKHVIVEKTRIEFQAFDMNRYLE